MGLVHWCSLSLVAFLSTQISLDPAASWGEARYLAVRACRGGGWQDGGQEINSLLFLFFTEFVQEILPAQQSLGPIRLLALGQCTRSGGDFP